MSLTSVIPYYPVMAQVMDILLVYLLTYRLLSWLKRTHAMDLIKGLSLIFAVFLVSNILDLATLNWILEKFTTVIIILVVIIFQPELRRFLERIGSTGHLFSASVATPEVQSTAFVHNIIRSVDFLSKEKVGALIVIECMQSLDEYIDTGIKIKGELNSEMLSSLFWPGSPTHDGAVIINESIIEAAGCFLPLTDTPIKDRRLGTRHRAALGLSEVSDAIVIVVSEENGVISLVEQGQMTRFLTKEALETRLFSLFSSPEYKPKKWIQINWKKLFNR